MTTTDIIDFAALLKILGYTDDEFVGLLYQKPGGLPHTASRHPPTRSPGLP